MRNMGFYSLEVELYVHSSMLGPTLYELKGVLELIILVNLKMGTPRSLTWNPKIGGL